MGKLHKDSTEDNLTRFLEDNDITVLSVKKLSAKLPWQENYAAYFLSVDYKDKDSVLNRDIWPDIAVVRDWVYTSKNALFYPW